MAFRTIRAQKLKSFFSLIGVLIGVTFLIAVVSIVQGMNRYMVDRFANALIGANTFELRQRPSIMTGDGDRRGLARVAPPPAHQLRRRRLRARADHARPPPSPSSARTGCRCTTRARWPRTSTWSAPRPTTSASGTTRSRPAGPSPRRRCRPRQPVLVVGYELAEKLLPGVDPVGKTVQIGGLPYRIIGVVAKQGTLFGLSLDKFAVMPFSAPGRRLICPINILDALIVRTDDPTDMQRAMGEAEAIMRSRRGLKPWQGNNFAFQTAEGALGTWQKISKILFLALPGLVAISLVVGGIVIMNIMLMAVSERTREIGIRKALGARRRDILAQFVVESATLSAAGALLGIGFGLALAFVVKALTPLPAAVAPWSVVVGMALGVGVGIVAGVYPASRASRLDPIVALRAE